MPGPLQYTVCVRACMCVCLSVCYMVVIPSVKILMLLAVLYKMHSCVLMHVLPGTTVLMTTQFRP